MVFAFKEPPTRGLRNWQLSAGADLQFRNPNFAASRVFASSAGGRFLQEQLHNRRESEIDGKDQSGAQTASAFLLSSNTTRDCILHHRRAAALQHADVPLLLSLPGKRCLHHDPQSGGVSIGKPVLAAERIHKPLRQDRQRRPDLPHRLFPGSRLRAQRIGRL